MYNYKKTLMLHEIFEDISKSETQKDAVVKLQQYNKSLGARDGVSMRTVLKGAFDKRIVWLVPTGEPPYTPNQGHNAASDLMKETTKFPYFAEGPHQIQNRAKREKVYIGLLEAIHPKDAAIVIDMVNKKSSYKHITPTVVKLAFGDAFLGE